MTSLREIAGNNRFNIHDVLFYTPAEPHSSIHNTLRHHTRLFGNANIGHEMLCNLWVPAQFPHGGGPSDLTAYVTGWYARTTLPASQALTDWAHLTRCNFRIGDQRIASASMAELLARHERMPIPRTARATPGGEEHEEITVAESIQREEVRAEARDDAAFLQVVGRELYEAHAKIMGYSWEWGTLTNHEQAKWYALAETARDQFDGGRVIICPPRQWFSIEVESTNTATEKLAELTRQPLAALWVHLDGYERKWRDW